MKTLILLIICALSFGTVYSNTQTNKNNTNMKTIVLVHGAWLDASSWYKIVPDLQAAGYEVIIVNLPGHGSDNTSPETINLQSYVDAVKNAIGDRTNVILLGHSMGGAVVTQTAEQIPSQLAKVIYIGAFVPQNGETLFQLANTDKESLLGKYLRPDEKAGTILVAPEGIPVAFANDLAQEEVDVLVANNKADPLIPFVSPVTLTAENYGKVNKVYIFTVNDKTVGYKLQQSMAKNAGITKTYDIQSGHLAFFSKPDELTEIILKEAK